MKESTYKKKLELIEDFFNDVKKAAQSLGEQQFPKIELLDDRVNKVLKMKASIEKADKEKDIQQIMKIKVSKLHGYLVPEAFFQKSDKKVINLWSDDESKKNKELANIDQKIENSTAEILQLEELSFENKEDREKMCIILNDKTLYKLQEKRDKIIASYNDSFYLPRLDEIKQNDPSPKELIYFLKLIRNNNLLEQYNKYWNRLWQYASQFNCNKQDLYQRNIAVSSFWAEPKTRFSYVKKIQTNI